MPPCCVALADHLACKVSAFVSMVLAYSVEHVYIVTSAVALLIMCGYNDKKPLFKVSDATRQVTSMPRKTDTPQEAHTPAALPVFCLSQRCSCSAGAVVLERGLRLRVRDPYLHRVRRDGPVRQLPQLLLHDPGGQVHPVGPHPGELEARMRRREERVSCHDRTGRHSVGALSSSPFPPCYAQGFVFVGFEVLAVIVINLISLYLACSTKHMVRGGVPGMTDESYHNTGC
jgi:hypothetical protein